MRQFIVAVALTLIAMNMPEMARSAGADAGSAEVVRKTKLAELESILHRVTEASKDRRLGKILTSAKRYATEQQVFLTCFATVPGEAERAAKNFHDDVARGLNLLRANEVESGFVDTLADYLDPALLVKAGSFESVVMYCASHKDFPQRWQARRIIFLENEIAHDLDQ
jgi:hypothetical protein